MIKKYRKEIGFVVSFLLLFLAVSFYDVFFQGKTFKVSTAVSQSLPTGVYGQADNLPAHFLTFGVDSAVYEEPTYHFIKKYLGQGIWPLWNPHQACGYPLVGMIQSGMFYPLNYILYIFPDAYGWDSLILTRFLLAGIFTYGFMRYLRFSPVAALAAAVIYMLSGPLVLIQNGTANVDILIPVLLLALEYFIRHPGKRGSVVIAAVVALMIIAGAPEHVFFNNLCGVLYVCFRLFTLRKRKDWRRAAWGLAGAYLLAFGLSALALFPFVWNFIHEFWHGHPPGMGTLVEENTGRWLSILLPHFFQHEPMSRDWQPSGWLGGYLGMIPVALAAMSLRYNHRRGLNYFFVFLAFLIVGKSYGLWFINWIGYLPLLKMSRYAYHTPPLAAFFVAVAAGMGVRSVLLSRRNFEKGLLFSLPMGLVILWHLAKAQGQAYWPLALQASQWAFVLLCVWQIILGLHDRKKISRRYLAILLVSLIMVELFSYIHRERPRRFTTHPAVPYLEYIQSHSHPWADSSSLSPAGAGEVKRGGTNVAPGSQTDNQPSRSYGLMWAFFPDTATGYGVDDLGIFDGLLMRRYVDFINELVLPNNFISDLRPTTLRVVPLPGVKEYLDLLNLKYLIAPAGMGLPPEYQSGDHLKLVYSAEVNIWERRDVLPRVFVVQRALFEPQDFPSYTSLLYYRQKLDRWIIVNHAPVEEISRQLNATPEKSESSAEIVSAEPNEMRVRARMAYPGFLVLTDTYHPDWRAYVDGQPAEIFEADNLFRAVFLGAGQREVRFVFRPMAFYWGGVISLLALGACFLLARKSNP